MKMIYYYVIYHIVFAKFLLFTKSEDKFGIQIDFSKQVRIMVTILLFVILIITWLLYVFLYLIMND